MQDLEFRHALRDEMALVTPPPPMNESKVLDAAKHALGRRRARLATAGSVSAVMALTAGAVIFAAGGNQSSQGVGTEITSTTTPDTSPDEPTNVVSSGFNYEQGVLLLNRLTEVVPPGFDAPPTLANANGVEIRHHEASTSSTSVKTWWTYSAKVPIVKDGTVGYLSAVVDTQDNSLFHGQGCEFARAHRAASDSPCQDVWVGGKQVGVLFSPGAEAFYQYPNGATVVISQSRGNSDFVQPHLAELPLTAQQIAELAADPGFYLE